MKNKEFRIGFYYCVYGGVKVTATSQKQAEDLVHKYLAEYGIEDLEYNQNDRDYHTEIIQY